MSTLIGSRLNVLSQAQRSRLKAHILRILTDPDADTVEITYRAETGRTVDLSAGTVTPATTPLTVRAIRREMETDTGRGIQGGDRTYIIAAESRTVEPSASDTIIDDGATFQVVSVARDGFGFLHHVHARREVARP